MSDTAAIEAEGLVKHYGKTRALNGLDLTVARGTVYGLLGPNGAGKTTAVRVLATLLRADGGQARVLGHDVATQAGAVRRVIGLTGQYAALDEYLTGRSNLVMIGELSRLTGRAARRRADELLEQFDLTDAADRAVKTYSGGMRRRLDLAAALVARPPILFLDEPTTGLDPRSRRLMWQTVRELVAGGVTIFLTTQQLEEADELADRIAVLDGGKLVAVGTPDELKRGLPGGHVRLMFPEKSDLGEALAVVNGSPDEDALTLDVPSDGGVRALRDLLDRLDKAGIEVAGLEVRTPDLEDVFYKLTEAAR